MRFASGLQLQRQLSYTKSLLILLPYVVPNAQNRALKKKLDSNPRYGPRFTVTLKPCIQLWLSLGYTCGITKKGKKVQ